MTYALHVYQSPMGALYLVANDKNLCGVAFASSWPRLQARFPEWREETTPLLREAARQLAEYFAGRRRSFALPLAREGTPFQKAVWASLDTIGYGETRSYKEQAVSLGIPQGARAVGLANSMNPLCVVVPCHRVVGSNGKMTGYAGGIDVKTKLLRFEKETR